MINKNWKTPGANCSITLAMELPLTLVRKINTGIVKTHDCILIILVSSCYVTCVFVLHYLCVLNSFTAKRLKVRNHVVHLQLYRIYVNVYSVNHTSSLKLYMLLKRTVAVSGIIKG